jgi:transposase
MPVCSENITMPFCHIDHGVKEAAVRIHKRDLLPLEDLLEVLRISRSTFFRVLQLFRETGSVVCNNGPRQGRPRSLLTGDIQYLLRLIRHRPDWFLDELLDLLATNRFISVHFTTIFRALERAGASRKKLKRIAKERNEILQADFVARMAQYEPDELGFLDETSKDERTIARRYGRSRRGRRASRKAVFIRGRRLSAEGLLTVDGIVASTVVEGSMTRDLYLQFLEYTVICLPSHFNQLGSDLDQLPMCSAYPGPLSVLVMDNVKVHHGEEILELTARFGKGGLHTAHSHEFYSPKNL